MLDARTGRTRVTNAAPPRATRYDARANRERCSTVEPCPLWSIEPSVINILPLKAKVKYWRTPPPACDEPIKLEVTFCVRGVSTDPCGVPVFVSDHLPSSITPALSHFWISRRIRGSATRCSTNLISQLLSRLSKNPRM